MSDPFVREASPGDVAELAPNLRACDRAECIALGWDPEKALEASYASSTQRYAIIDGSSVIGMFGAGPTDMPQLGSIWLLGSDRIQGIRFRFLRESRTWVERMHGEFPALWNRADSRNLLHLRWLQWLGFTIIGTAPHETSGVVFHQFIKVKPPCAYSKQSPAA